jgi:uncharacterized protein
VIAAHSRPGSRIGFEHLDRLATLLSRQPRTPSEYSLANLFFYRARHAYALVDDRTPFVLGRTYDGECHALPLGELDEETALRWLDEVDCIYPLDEKEARRLARDGRLRIDSRDADADYLYDRRRLETLAGAKAKRAQAARFALLRPQLCPFVADDAQTVLDGWLEDAGRGPDHADAHECAEAIARQADLALDGMLVRLDGEPVAFLLAGPPRARDRIVHFAKGRREYAGAYPWMFSQFAAAAGTHLLNFEQDLGNPGLAQSKRSLGPIGLVRKYRLRKNA